MLAAGGVVDMVSFPLFDISSLRRNRVYFAYVVASSGVKNAVCVGQCDSRSRCARYNADCSELSLVVVCDPHCVASDYRLATRYAMRG